MTDEDYREYLTALAQRHMNIGWLHAGTPDMRVMGHDIDRISSASRFLWTVHDRSENNTLLKELAQELKNLHLEHVINEMERSGVLSALDESPEITFGELRRSAIPAEDAQLLARAGIHEAYAEVTLLIHYARKRIGTPQSLPSEIVRQADSALKKAAAKLENTANSPGVSAQPTNKKRKLFSGIGKLLGGTITAAGNLLLATGTLVAPNPLTGYLVIGSSALAVASIGEGVELLRGD